MDPLEWSRILDLTTERVRTPYGEALILALNDEQAWATDINTAQVFQQRTAEAQALLSRDALWGVLSDLVDLDEPLERLAKASVLEVRELHELRRWLDAIESWTEVPLEEIKGEYFKRDLKLLPDVRDDLKTLRRVLTLEGTISESATPKLRVLFSEIRGLQNEISSRLESIVRALSQKGVLQHDVSDLRDGRYVVPVRISAQSEVAGLITDASASGQTVYIEPAEISALNARLQKTQSDLQREIFALLTEVSQALQPHVDSFRQGIARLGLWDSCYAKAQMGLVYGGKPIQITDQRKLKLPSTAHPLLWWSIDPDQIIRNDIEINEPAQALLLTGPNTGGKTVLLKTVGLAAIFARTGFLFPASSTVEVPFFESIFADLGDPQSIENHLSSFSGHVMRFKDILENATPKSLVLIDELNSATDPEEGAALGRAILESILERRSTLIATTHDPRLKAMAISDDRLQNASMAFDETSQAPSYQIVNGIPGRSHALSTAERLGMPAEVIRRARSYLSEDHVRMEGLLQNLHSDASAALQARREAQRIRDEAEKLRLDWTEKTRTTAQELLERTKVRLKRVIEQAQDAVRTTVRKLEEAKSRKDVENIRGEMGEFLKQSEREIEKAFTDEAPEIAAELKTAGKLESETSAEPEQKSLPIGSRVHVPKYQAVGEVIALKGNLLEVALGTLRVKVSRAEIEAVQGRTPPRKSAPIASTAVSTPDARLDLRGKRFEEAMIELEQYLDLAFRSRSYSQVTVVHGLGTGAIREGTRKLLKKLPYIKSFGDGGPGNGGSGATVVELDW